MEFRHVLRLIIKDSSMKPINVNPFSDFGFKKIFGEESGKDILLDFVNAVLEGRCEPIVQLSYSKQEYVGQTEEFRKAIFDIHCLTDKMEYVIVEMQKAIQLNFKDRSLFYGTIPIQIQAKKGNWDFQLKTVYCISILNFRINKTSRADRKYLHEIALTDRQTNQVFHEKLRFFYLELPNFRKKSIEKGTKIEKWLFLLSKLEYLDKLPIHLQDKIFAKVMDKASLAKLSKEEWIAYEQSVKYERDYNNTISTAKILAEEEGFSKGIKKGIKKGKIEGIAEGIEKGKIESAINFKKLGLDISLIAKATGISEEELHKLFKNKEIQ